MERRQDTSERLSCFVCVVQLWSVAHLKQGRHKHTHPSDAFSDLILFIVIHDTTGTLHSSTEESV